MDVLEKAILEQDPTGTGNFFCFTELGLRALVGAAVEEAKVSYEQGYDEGYDAGVEEARDY